jgi:hypothetical protein
MATILQPLKLVRAETLRYLDGVSEDELQTRKPLPESWHGYFGGPAVELEEIVRWVAYHEYYHLGQLIISIGCGLITRTNAPKTRRAVAGQPLPIEAAFLRDLEPPTRHPVGISF